MDDGNVFRCGPEILEGFASNAATQAVITFLMADLKRRGMLDDSQASAVFDAAARAIEALPKSDRPDVDEFVASKYARTIDGLRAAVLVGGVA